MVMFLDTIEAKFTGKDVLDVGCGAGYMEKRFGDASNSFRSLDIIDQNIFGVKVDIYSGEDIPHKDKSFDTICLFHVLEHVNSKRKLVKECHRVLRYSGEIHVIIPNGSMWLLLRCFSALLPDHLKSHACFSETSLYGLMSFENLTDRKPVIMGLFWYYCFKKR